METLRESILKNLSVLYDDLLQIYKENGCTSYDAGRIYGLKMAIEEVERATDGK